MNKIIFSLIFSIFLLGFISAQLTIIPSNININNTYPGEIIKIPINITTDGEEAVFFNSNNHNILISPNFTIVNGFKSLNLSIILSNDISSGNLNFDILSNIYEEEVSSSGSCGTINSNGNSCYYTLNNGTNANCNNSSVCGLNYSNNNNNSNSIPYNSIPPTNNPIVYIGFGLIMCLIGIYFSYDFFKKRKNKYNCCTDRFFREICSAWY